MEGRIDGGKGEKGREGREEGEVSRMRARPRHSLRLPSLTDDQLVFFSCYVCWESRRVEKGGNRGERERGRKW